MEVIAVNNEQEPIDAPGAAIPCSQDQPCEQEPIEHPGEPAPEPDAPGNIPEYEDPEYIPLHIPIDIIGNKFTDVWNADRFVDRYGGIVRYCHTRDQFFIWNGLLWEKDEYNKIHQMCTGQIESLIADHAAINTHELLKHLVKSLSPAGIRAMIFFLSANRIPIREDQIDADPDRVNVLNGVINLSTVQYEHPNRDRFITRRMNVNYDPLAGSPLWLDHLDLIFGGDQETIRSFQMIAGYALLRMNPEQLFFILHGAGENGKSVTLNVLSFIIGEYAANADPRTFTHRRSDDNTVRSDIARLYTAHLVTAIESSEGVRLNEGLLKAITGHDKITSRELYEKEQERHLDAKIFFATNHEPIIKDTTHGMLRRIIKIPFAFQIPPHKRDDQIEEKLKAEAPGIFNWLLDGLRAWHANGRKIKLSPAITTATNVFKKSIDEWREFFTDDIEITGRTEDTILKNTLFEIGKQWYSDIHGEYPPIKQQAFNKICMEHGIKKDGRQGHTGKAIWIGVRHITPLEREARAKKREEDQKEDNHNKKNQASRIAQLIKDGKNAQEIFDLYMQNGEGVRQGEPYPVSSHNYFPCKDLLDKPHRASPDHPLDHPHVIKTANGFQCGSKCGSKEQTACSMSPDKCGYGVRY